MNSRNIHRTVWGAIGSAVMTIGSFGALNALLPTEPHVREARVLPQSASPSSATMPAWQSAEKEVGVHRT